MKMRLALLSLTLGTFACTARKPAEEAPKSAGSQAAAPQSAAQADAPAEAQAEAHAKADAPAQEAQEAKAQADAPPLALGPGWSQVAEADLKPAQQQALARGRAARKQVSERLQGALQAALKEGGPTHAVGFCNTEAPGLHTADLPEGVRLGRSSHRLRNPNNKPPVWTVSRIAAQENKPLLVEGHTGIVGELVPIPMAPVCATCHGQKESFTPELTQILAQHYPQDAATGFAEGDLRGWFWFEADPL